MTHVSVTVCWGDFAIDQRLVREGGAYTCAAVGPHVIARVDGGRAWVSDGTSERVLVVGQVATLASGPLDIVVECGGEPLPRAPRARFDRRAAACHAFAAAAVGVGLVACGFSEPSGDEEATAEEAVVEMRALLLAAQATPEEDEPDGREGGTGTRAKGEEGQMGRAHRYGIAGPNEDPHIQRQAALRDAAEFGSIGLTGAAAAAAASEPSAPKAGGFNPPPGGAPAADADADAAFGERFTDYGVSAPVDAATDPMSTFAVDVDTGSYSIVRSAIRQGSTVPPAAVRPEELLNYFDYGYAPPEDGTPLVAHVDAAPSPFDDDRMIVRVGVQARRASTERRTPAHLVYLVDVSGSMQAADRIGMAQQSLRLLTDALKPGDTVALCTYAGDVRVALPPTGIEHRDRILAGIDGLTAGGSTAMGSGIDLAYRLADETLVRGHINRVIILSDGDANVGATSHEDILATIERYRERGITLSTIGFGTGNYNDTMMEQLADRGDGNYRYIDGPQEARRVFVDQLDGMLEVVARDVKIQVAFDSSQVRSYRLIGYDNRDVADQDFRDDRVDGGEVGAGHQVTALYEVALHPRLGIDRRSWLTVHVRHKDPAGGAATERVYPLTHDRIARSFGDAGADLRFATAVAGFAEVLRKSPYATTWGTFEVHAIARAASVEMSPATRPDRMELIELVEQVEVL